MSSWDIARLRQIAGLPLVESKQINEGWGDDDDEYEDDDVKIAMSDKGQREFEKKNKKDLDKNAQMLRDRTLAQRKAAEEKKAEKKAGAKPAEEKKAEDKPAEEKKADEKPAEEKKVEDKPVENKPTEEKKRRGAKPNENSKSGGMRAWLNDNPTATRGQFIAAAAERGMSKHHANTYFYTLKKARSAVSEAFIIVHPHMKSFVLAENRELNRMQWIDTSSDLEPLMYQSLAEAEKMVKYMAEWKGQATIVERVQFDE